MGTHTRAADPDPDPATVAGDLVDAIGEGINNAQALIGSPAPPSIPAVPGTEDRDAANGQVSSAPGATLKTLGRDVSDGVAQILTAVGSPLPQPRAVIRDDLGASRRKAARELAATRGQINQTVGAVKSVIGDGRTIVRSAGSDNGANAVTASPARKTPVRDAVTKASSDITKVVTKVSDSMKKALSGGRDDNQGEGNEGAAG